jgi:hypothetical protein
MLKKLYATILALTVLAIALSTSVYAWFSITGLNFVQDIEFGADGNDILKISLDGKTYGDTITRDQLSEIYGERFRLKTVTTTNNIDFTEGPPLFPRSDANKDFLSIEIHFRLTTNQEDPLSHQRYVYLADRVYLPYTLNPPSGTYIESKGVDWQTPIDYQGKDGFIEAGTVERYYAKDAIRIGVRNDDEGINFIYDVSEQPQYGYGLPIGANDFARRAVSYQFPEPLPLVPGIMRYKLTEFHPLQPDIAMDKQSLVSKLSLVSSEEGVTTYEGKATITIWLEGWDPDCIDGIIRDQIVIQLRFRATRYYEDLEESLI